MKETVYTLDRSRLVHCIIMTSPVWKKGTVITGIRTERSKSLFPKMESLFYDGTLPPALEPTSFELMVPIVHFVKATLGDNTLGEVKP